MQVRVDLAAQKLVLADGREIELPGGQLRQACLLEGVDELGYILLQEPAIARLRSRSDWLD